MAYDTLVKEAKDLPEEMIEQIIEFMRFLKRECLRWKISSMLTHQWLDGRNPRMQEKGMLARHSFFMLLIVGVHCGKRACDKNDTKHR